MPVSSNVRPRRQIGLQLIAPMNTKIKFEPLASVIPFRYGSVVVGMQRAKLPTPTINFLSQPVVNQAFGAVASKGSEVIMCLAQDLSKAIQERGTSATFAALSGAARCAPPGSSSGAAEAEYSYRFRHFLAPAVEAASPLPSQCGARGAGCIASSSKEVTRLQRQRQTARPNTSLNRTFCGSPGLGFISFSPKPGLPQNAG